MPPAVLVEEVRYLRINTRIQPFTKDLYFLDFAQKLVFFRPIIIDSLNGAANEKNRKVAGGRARNMINCYQKNLVLQHPRGTNLIGS